MSQLRTYHRDVARMISVDIEDTTLQPVTLDEAKSYARIDQNTEDIIIDTLIDSARKAFEHYTGKLLFERTVTVVFECVGEALMILPYLPVASITSVQCDEEDVDYALKGDRINVTANGEVEVVYECGLYEELVDSEDKLGILKYITSNYEDRQDVAAISVSDMPNSSRKHWQRYRTYSL